jgi:membrane protein DedA with SNARE-associated domain
MTLVTVPLAALVVASYVGDALAPSLVDSHPALLIALNARNRNLALVTNYLDPWTFYGIGVVRLLLSDPLFFLLGLWYGDAAVKWMERRTKTWGQMLRQLEEGFGRFAYPIVFLAPNNVFCLFAGAAGMPLRGFVAVNVAGTVFRLWLIRRFGETFDGPIDDLVGWIGDHRVPLLIVSIGFVLLSIALEAKRGDSEVTALVHMDDDLDRGAADAADGDGDGDDGHGADAEGGGDDGAHRAEVGESGDPDGGPDRDGADQALPASGDTTRAGDHLDD